MVEYATAECATCHAIRPKNEMREVRVQRLQSRTSRRGNGNRRTSGHSSSYGGKTSVRFGNSSSNSTRTHSNTQEHFAVLDLWVCHGCKDPKSDSSGIGAIGVIAVLVIGGVIYALSGGFSKEPTNQAIALDAISSTTPEIETSLPANAAYVSDGDASSTDDLAQMAASESIGSQGETSEQPAVTDESEALERAVAVDKSSATDSREKTQDEERQAYCANITAEGRANSDYLKSIGC